MQAPHPLLVAALIAAPRRYRLPALPGHPAARGSEVALAAAIDSARMAAEERTAPAPATRERFTASLADLIRSALGRDGGDPAFQASVWRASHAEVEEFVELSATVAGDRRAVRSAVDAIAHPGKLRDTPSGAVRDALERLRSLAVVEAWSELERAAEAPPLRELAQAIRASPALQRLLRREALLQLEQVRRYQALCERIGPAAGSHAAARQGRAASRAGAASEAASVRALEAIARHLQRDEPGASYRVVRNLRTPAGFPGRSGQAKEEWDAAIVRAGPADDDIVLLVEVKASPAAAAPDLPRLLRGLSRLAQAEPERAYRFACADGELSLGGRTLRALQPHDQALPPHVIYCCSAMPEAQPAFLAPAARAVLLDHPASIGFAQRLAGGAAPQAGELAPVWNSLLESPRMRPVLHQLETARAAREAMLHPDDLAASVERIVGPPGPTK